MQGISFCISDACSPCGMAVRNGRPHPPPCEASHGQARCSLRACLFDGPLMFSDMFAPQNIVDIPCLPTAGEERRGGIRRATQRNPRRVCLYPRLRWAAQMHGRVGARRRFVSAYTGLLQRREGGDEVSCAPLDIRAACLEQEPRASVGVSASSCPGQVHHDACLVLDISRRAIPLLRSQTRDCTSMGCRRS